MKKHQPAQTVKPAPAVAVDRRGVVDLITEPAVKARRQKEERERPLATLDDVFASLKGAPRT